MRGNELLDKMELIDPSFVEAADKMNRKKHVAWMKWGVAAACLGLVSLGLWSLLQKQTQIPAEFVELKTITVSELNAAQGYEGYLCYEISELENGNPWTENMKLSTLPVYKNDAYDASGAGIPKGLSKSELIERFSYVTEVLQLEVISTKTHVEKLLTTQIDVETDKGRLQLQADGTITYFPVEEEVVFPELVEKYAAFLQFENAELVSYGTYNFYGDFYPNYKLYDSSGDEVEDILNYNFSSVQFAPDQDGKLFLIRKEEELLVANKLGDYPVISVKEATSRLLDGKYQTSVPFEFPGKKYIGKVEIIYRTGSSEKYLLPYYRFYVELVNEELDNGLKTYGAYYVPAIAEEYIANMPIYDGSLN